MRYPVTDDFAIDLSAKLYNLLAGKGRPLPRALGMALTEIAGKPPTAKCPALSAGTPVLVGSQAVNLRLTAPARAHPESYDTSELKMAGFEPQPDRFVGRTAGWPAPAPRWRRRAEDQVCCCTACRAAERPRARWNWPIPMSSPSTGWSGSRRPARARTLPARSTTSRSSWNGACQASRWSMSSRIRPSSAHFC